MIIRLPHSCRIVPAGPADEGLADRRAERELGPPGEAIEDGAELIGVVERGPCHGGLGGVGDHQVALLVRFGDLDRLAVRLNGDEPGEDGAASRSVRPGFWGPVQDFRARDLRVPPLAHHGDEVAVAERVVRVSDLFHTVHLRVRYLPALVRRRLLDPGLLVLDMAVKTGDDLGAALARLVVQRYRPKYSAFGFLLVLAATEHVT